MRRSMRGHALPESPADFALLYGQQCLQFYHCVNCRLAFPGRVTTEKGWRETQLSGYCETCFDEIFDKTRIALKANAAHDPLDDAFGETHAHRWKAVP